MSPIYLWPFITSQRLLKKTTLFAATVAAFIIESYKQLSPDSGAATVTLLNQISQQLASPSNGTQGSSSPPPLYSNSSFRPARSAIRINILWFLSFVLSLICALSATLMQQWARRYQQLAQAETTLYKRARTRAYLFQGVKLFGLSQAVEAVPALLHVAVFLFFAGLIDFLFSVDTTVGRVILGVMCFFAAIYIFLTFLPNLRPNCPYRTPFSRDFLKWILVVTTAPALLMIWCLRNSIPSNKFGMVPKRFLLLIRRLRNSIPGDKFGMVSRRLLLFVRSLQSTMSDAMQSLEEEIDKKALQWTVETVDDEDNIETFIEGIPEFLKAETSTNALPIIKELLDLQQPKPLGQHIDRLIQTCTADSFHGTNEKLRKRRALICLDTVRNLTVVHSSDLKSFSELFGDKSYSSLYSLERDEDSVIAINAISTGALIACTYLRLILESSGQVPNQESNQKPADIEILRQLVNAPWHKADLGSFPGCHLLVLQGFVSSLLPHLNSVTPGRPTGFRVVWETLPRILSMARFGHPNRRSRESFLALWAELENDFAARPVTDTDDVLPIVQLMSMLRPTVESIQVSPIQDGQDEAVAGAS